jgi:hypothetical protein
MRSHVEQGERGMAIQAYDRCRAVLAEMLDAAPSAETQAGASLGNPRPFEQASPVAAAAPVAECG